MKKITEKSVLLAAEVKTLTDETLKNFEVGTFYSYNDYRFVVVEKVGRDNGSPLWSVDIVLTNERTIEEAKAEIKAAAAKAAAAKEEEEKAAAATEEEAARKKLAAAEKAAEEATSKGYLKSIGDFKKLVGCTYKTEYKNKGTGKIVVLSAEDIKKATDAKKTHFAKAGKKVTDLFASVLPAAEEEAKAEEAAAEEAKAEEEEEETEETVLDALKALTDVIKSVDKAKKSVLDKTAKLAAAADEKAKAKAEKALTEAEAKAAEEEATETEKTGKALKSLLWFASEVFADETEKALTKKALAAKAAAEAAKTEANAKEVVKKAKNKELSKIQTEAFNALADATDEDLQAFKEFLKQRNQKK